MVDLEVLTYVNCNFDLMQQQYSRIDLDLAYNGYDDEPQKYNINILAQGVSSFLC